MNLAKERYIYFQDKNHSQLLSRFLGTIIKGANQCVAQIPDSSKIGKLQETKKKHVWALLTSFVQKPQ